MSKQMTREEAVKILKAVVDEGYENIHDEALEALTILAPEPRTEKPTVEQAVEIWYSDAKGIWCLTPCDYVREHFTNGDTWLPLSALPQPKGTP